MHLLNYYEETIVDGPGLRFAFYFAGCRHGCIGCHNKESWLLQSGKKMTPEIFAALVEKIQKNKYLDGITLSGGDPFYNPEALLRFLQELKKHTKLPILVYTGFTIEQLFADRRMKESLQYIDMIIDGKYEADKRYPLKPFRGSWNQRMFLLSKGEIVGEIE